MDLNEYRTIYLSYEVAFNQTRLIAITAGAALEDFPSNLPSEAHDDIVDVLSDTFTNIEKRLRSKNRTPSDRTIQLKVPESKLGQKLAPPILNFFVAQSLSNQEVGTFNFDSLLYGQELVMLLAHLEAFMSDSLRVICRKEPRVLHGSKKIEWGKILECGSWENVIERLTGEYCYEFGWLSIRDKLKFLESEHGLKMRTPQEEIQEVDAAEKLRHIIIHNGGRVSQEYLERTRREDIKVGDVIPVTAEYTERIYDILRLLSGDIYAAIASKFFKVDGENLTGFWNRGIKSSS